MGWSMSLLCVKIRGVYNLIVKIWHGGEHEARIGGFIAGILTFIIFIIGFALSYLIRRVFDKHYSGTWIRRIALILLPFLYLFLMVFIAATIRKVI